MATYLLGSADNERIQWHGAYDDVTNLLASITCANNSDQGPTPRGASTRLWLANDPTKDFPDGAFNDPTLAHITPAGVTETVNIPTSQARKMQLVVVDHHGNPAVSNLLGELI
jgi:hypothetical protein